MILGLVLILLGYLVPVPILATLGFILLVVGVVLLVVPNLTGGRRFY